MAQVSSASTFFLEEGHKNFGRLNKKLFLQYGEVRESSPPAENESNEISEQKESPVFFIGVGPKPEKRKKIV